MTLPTKAIEAGARAIYKKCGEHRDSTVRQLEYSFSTASAKACIEAAIAFGELVPASAVAAERERCVDVVDGYAPATTDMLSSKIAEICDDIVADIRSLEPASGEFVVVPRSDLARVVEIAWRSEAAPEIERVRALLNAATKDGGGS